MPGECFTYLISKFQNWLMLGAALKIQRAPQFRSTSARDEKHFWSAENAIKSTTSPFFNRDLLDQLELDARLAAKSTFERILKGTDNDHG
ncbi:MAG: hypothetical protein EOO38_01370 [Cytophagaceae bacterium]|nr:MAG: hypothetical protein EOO38_01370 [Cytophagaceae bacterium]